MFAKSSSRICPFLERSLCMYFFCRLWNILMSNYLYFATKTSKIIIYEEVLNYLTDY